MRLATMQCSICGDDMEFEVIELELVSRQGAHPPGWYCWTCKVSSHTAQDLFLVDHHDQQNDEQRSDPQMFRDRQA